MKKLIYFSFVLFIILLDASCTKDTAVAPAQSVPPPDGTATVELDNNSSTPYAVEFAGVNKYEFDMPAHSKQEITVKGDETYNVDVSSSGTHAPNTIVLHGQPAVIAQSAQFDSVAISDSDQEVLSISN